MLCGIVAKVILPRHSAGLSKIDNSGRTRS